MRRSRALCLAVVLAVATPLAHADDRPPLPPVSIGARVRVHSPAVGGEAAGEVTAFDRASLTIAAGDGAPVRVPLEGLRRLEISGGKKSNVKRGLMLGAALGAAASLLYVPPGCPVSGGGGIECNKAVVAGAAALGGATVGGIVGIGWRTERWTALPGGRPAAAAGGPQLQVTLRF